MQVFKAIEITGDQVVPLAERMRKEGRMLVMIHGYIQPDGRSHISWDYEVGDTVEFGGDDSVARMVDATLANPKSWTADGAVAFQRVSDAEPSFRVTLASPMTVRESCGYDIELESSCYNSTTGRVYLNLARWVRGARSFQGDIGSYRQYLVNHEVGHAIGFPAHEPCPADGALAPVMMQQTFGVNNGEIHRLDPEGVVPDNDDTCRYNAWPFPDGAPAA